MTPDKLLAVYKSVIRPTADYCSVVYNSLIPKYISDSLEAAQRHALRIIYGRDADINQIMENKDIETLLKRREKKSLEFAIKAASSERFGKRWFVKNTAERPARDTTRKKYIEKFTRSERGRNNPILHMTRLLNEHERP